MFSKSFLISYNCQFCVAEVYRSIYKDRLINAIDHARILADISGEVIVTIMHCRKSLLFNNANKWIKKTAMRLSCNPGQFRRCENLWVSTIFIYLVLHWHYFKSLQSKIVKKLTKIDSFRISHRYNSSNSIQQ